MIQLDRLVKTYGMSPVLRGISLQIPAGQFASLVGPNGAGKSTLLRIVATLMPATSGTVRVGGWTLPQEAQRVRPHIGFVSHHPLLYSDLTAQENLAFFGRLYGLELDEKTLRQALRRVGLAVRARDTVDTFSRGMVQRLTIARATLHQPDVLLLDEPFSGLDQDAAAILDSLLRAEHEAGRTILMITHDLLRAHSLSDRLMVLHQGRIRVDLDVEDVEPAGFLTEYTNTTRRKPDG